MGARGVDVRGQDGCARKSCGWLTNQPLLAELVEDVCANQKPGDEWHKRCYLLGGLAKKAQVHPPALVKAVLRACRDEMRARGELSALDGATAGPTPVAPVVPGSSPLGDYWDDVNGGFLKPEKVREARLEELAWFHTHEVWVPRTIQECHEKAGGPPVPVMWLGTNKGDDVRELYRIRFVVRERRGKGSEETTGESFLLPSCSRRLRPRKG